MTVHSFRQRWFLVGLRWIVGATFLYAGIVKLHAPQDFADSIASFQLLPAGIVNAFALGLPPFEILVALLLLSGWQKRAAALAVLGLTAIFAVAMLSALARGLTVDCGCFGGGQPSALKTWISLGRDLAFFAAAFVIHQSSDGPPRRSYSIPS